MTDWLHQAIMGIHIGAGLAALLSGALAVTLGCDVSGDPT